MKNAPIGRKTVYGIALLTILLLTGTAAAAGVFAQNGTLNATGSLYVGPAGSTLFVNSTSGFVGIGTANSSRPLHVAATQDANIRLQDASGASPAAYIEFYNDTTRWGYVGLGGHDDRMVIGTTVEKNLTFYTNDSAKMTLAASGNLGVGTANPQAKVHTYSSTGSGTHYILLEGNGTIHSTVGIQFKNELGAKGAALTSFHGDLAFDIGNWSPMTRAMTILNTGSVGIGTASPAGPLHVKVTPAFSATGGTITYSEGYTIHTFTSSGTFTPNAAGSVEVLVVAGGGGGGGSYYGGGGGAGGLVYQSSRAVAAQAYTVTVGAGGAGGQNIARGSNGSNSAFDTITAVGGGGGGSYSANPASGYAGGSGGGAATDGATPRTGGAATQGNSGGGTGYGNAGGNSIYSAPYYAGGGGGGAGAVGANAVTGGGNGGAGLQYSQFSTVGGSPAGWFAGGGGAGSYSAPAGIGGNGGGGNGTTSGWGKNATANTGGGGGGGEYDPSNGGNGGSGIVIVRYPANTSATAVDSIVVSSAGKVGIGTASPAGFVDIRSALNDIVLIGDSVADSTGKEMRVGLPHYTNAEEPVGVLYAYSDPGDSLVAIGGATSAFNAPRTIAFFTAANDVTPAGTERMRISSAGNVGIGTTSPSYTLTVAGTAWVTSGAWSGSDARWKQNVTSLSPSTSLGKILSLRPVNFEWRTSEFPEMNFINGTQVGFIAQEVEKIIPEIVTTDDKGYKGISYEKITPVITSAVQEQQNEIAALRTENELLKSELCAKDNSYLWCD